MSTFRAFQTGLAAGQEQRKYRDENDARTQAADAFKSGNFEGAVAPLMRVGLMQEADAYGQAGQRKQETEQTQTYAKAYQTGLGAGPAPSKKIAQPPAGMAPETGMVPPPTGLGQGPTPQQPQQPNVRGGIEGVRAAAAARGDFETVAKMDEMIANVDKSVASMSEQQRANYKDGMEFLGQTALNLQSVAPELRGEEAIRRIQNSPYANPQILQIIQQAAADGQITNDELAEFAGMSMSVADRVKMNQPKAPSYSTVNTRDGIIAYNTSDPTQTVPLGQAPIPVSQQGPQTRFRPATPEEAAMYGAESGQINDADGRFYPGAKPTNPGKPTASQDDAAFFAQIALNGLNKLNELEATGYNRAGVGEQVAGSILGGTTGNGEQERLYDNAMLQFIDGYLRAMTGAAASPDEIENYKIQWAPQWGDSPAVVKQKAQGRALAVEAMKRQAGPAWKPEMNSGPKAPQNMQPPSAASAAVGAAARNASAIGGQAQSASDLGDDELRAMLGL